MFNHVQLFVSNLKKSTEFYTTALNELGIEKLWEDGRYTSFGIKGKTFLWLEKAGKKPVTSNVLLGFPASSQKKVGEFYRVAIEAGGKPNSEPGYREFRPKYYAAYVSDPDGNILEAVTFNQ